LKFESLSELTTYIKEASLTTKNSEEGGKKKDVANTTVLETEKFPSKIDIKLDELTMVIFPLIF